MTKFSDHFNLGLNQGSLDFVNIDTTHDEPVYIDPHAVRTQSGDFIESCQISISSFFNTLISAIQENNEGKIRDLILPLTEPNETHLGESRGVSRGRSLGNDKRANELISALRRSKAIKSGLLKDIEETIVFIEGIGVDILSDITTCLIRSQLIQYTINQCTFHGIPTEEQHIGPTWNPEICQWEGDRLHDLPRGPEGALLLVPKSIVRVRSTLDKGKYFRNYIRPIYEDREINKGARSEFTKLIAAGTANQRYEVDKSKLDDHLGWTKPDVTKHTENHPQALIDYRISLKDPIPPIDNNDLIEITGDSPTNFNDLVGEIKAINPGHHGATSYHRAVAALLNAILQSSLGNESIESNLHGGLKRIDITYDNVAGDGFFRWISLHYNSAIIPVECKNYNTVVGNPEVDQIAMRLSPDRGQVGLLISRNVVDSDAIERRCKSVAMDVHGYIIHLDDADLETLVSDISRATKEGTNPRIFPLLRYKFGRLLGDG